MGQVFSYGYFRREAQGKLATILGDQAIAHIFKRYTREYDRSLHQMGLTTRGARRHDEFSSLLGRGFLLAAFPPRRFCSYLGFQPWATKSQGPKGRDFSKDLTPLR